MQTVRRLVTRRGLSVRQKFGQRSIWMQPTADPPSLGLALAVITGLPVALWTYKEVFDARCVPAEGYIPPGSRTEELSSLASSPRISYEEINIKTADNANLSGIAVAHKVVAEPRTILFYMQGNAGNPLHRLPVFETLLSRSHSSTQIVAVAPRSYWKSSPRRPSEQGILSDYRNALNYTISRWPNSSIILYGHSLGGSVAVRLTSVLKSEDYPNVKGLILENPFASIPKMVTALYPQRWLPYHYLTPFVLDKWDAIAAMKNMDPDSLLAQLSRDMLMLLSEKDEVVPTSMGAEVFGLVEGEGTRRQVMIKDALHENAWQQRQWLVEMTKFAAQFCHPSKS